MEDGGGSFQRCGVQYGIFAAVLVSHSFYSSLAVICYVMIFFATAVMCWLRARVNHAAQAGWRLIGTAFACWGSAQLYQHFAMGHHRIYPSLTDMGRLSFYPLLIVGVALLGRKRLPHMQRQAWLSGVIGLLAVATFSVSLVYEPLVRIDRHSSLIVAMTRSSYSVWDFGLLALVTVLIGLAGWRPGWSFMCIFIGLLSFWAADTDYLLTKSAISPKAGLASHSGWVLCAVLFAYVAWQSRPHDMIPPVLPVEQCNQETRLSVPLFCTVGVGALLLYGNYQHVTVIAQALAVVTLLALLLQMSQVFTRARALASQMTEISLTDTLTALGNRRRLMNDIEHQLKQAEQGGPGSIFAIFDLNGFKAYNDTYGHPAGDALLRRLAKGLELALGNNGVAYRLGGDEFCVLLPFSPQVSNTLRLAEQALSEYGEGFSIDAAYGSSELPREAATVSEVMRFADRRMYAQKASGRTSVGTQMRDVLLRTLSARDRMLSANNADAAGLAQHIVTRLSISSEDQQSIIRAAELHDIGKVAVPDDILYKPGELTSEEWETMRLHSIISEKILDAAPALAHTARLVRSSHERWDGTGYPDRLAGNRIPLGSRIVAVCDAYSAMLNDRPYRSASSPAEAQAELVRCSGTQFDPQIVKIALEVIAEIPITVAADPVQSHGLRSG